MNAANNKGPTDTVLDDGVDVESVALRLGITEDAVRKICYENQKEILERMRDSADEAIREIAYSEGYLSMEEPEPPTVHPLEVARFAKHSGFESIALYDDRIDPDHTAEVLEFDTED